MAEAGDDDELRLSADGATFVLARLAPGVALLRASGHDKGQFGAAPFDWLDGEIRRYRVIEVFVDMRSMINATHSVAESWSSWIAAHRSALEHMSLLTASKYVHMTVEVAKLFSRTGNLMRVYTHTPAFEDAVGRALGKPFVLGATLT